MLCSSRRVGEARQMCESMSQIINHPKGGFKVKAVQHDNRRLIAVLFEDANESEMWLGWGEENVQPFCAHARMLDIDADGHQMLVREEEIIEWIVPTFPSSSTILSAHNPGRKQHGT